MIFATRADDRRWYLVTIATLVLAAWIALWLWSTSPIAGLLGHQASGVSAYTLGPRADRWLHTSHRPPELTGPLRFGAFLLGWTLMTVAMMLPGSLPVLSLFRRIVAGRADRHGLVLLLGLGYLGTWAGVAVLAYFGDNALRRIVANSSMLQANRSMTASVIFLLAGVYQFTSLKYKCLEQITV